jgi:Flp pilus assembly pilin Flp
VTTEAAPAAPPKPDDRLPADGESGAVMFEYALVVAAIVIPLMGAVIYVFRVLTEMYRVQMMFLNLPFP